jgi:two-component system, cell cycle sensor histidine kinase and response regulator CckA
MGHREDESGASGERRAEGALLKVQQELRESQERFRRLAEAAHEGIAITERGRIVDANRQLAEMLGYQAHELLGMAAADFVAPESRALVSDHMKADHEGPYEHLALRKDGKKICVEVRARSLRSGDQPLRVTVIRDMSERRELEERWRETEKLQAVGRLAGGIAHDFNNLLSVILGCADLLERSLPPGSEGREPAAEIAAAASRAASLTRQLLAFSRTQVFDLQVVDLNEVVRGMLRMLERLLGDGVRVVTRLDSDLPLVRADIGQIEQIVMNLCTNARDAMPDGGDIAVATEAVVIAPDAREGRLGSGRWVRLSVKDRGVGMSSETLSRALEPFFTTKEVGRGTGLGLATVHGIVTQSKGHMAIESAPGEGTTVNVWLAALDETSEGLASPERGPAPGGQETVLLVEDDAGVRALIEWGLRENGYHVVVAPPGSVERVVASHAGPIDLLVSDVVMPGTSGPRVAAAVRASHPKVKVLYVSGYSNKQVDAQGESFLAKPFTFTALTRKVREVLDSV